jgi:hypothetical protein
MPMIFYLLERLCGSLSPTFDSPNILTLTIFISLQAVLLLSRIMHCPATLKPIDTPVQPLSRI